MEVLVFALIASNDSQRKSLEFDRWMEVQVTEYARFNSDSIFLSKIEAESSDESKNERGVEGEEKREVQHDHPAERRNRLGL